MATSDFASLLDQDTATHGNRVVHLRSGIEGEFCGVTAE